MCLEPAKLADSSKTSPVHLRQFCKTHLILGMRSVVRAEALANMAETTNEQDAALAETYH